MAQGIILAAGYSSRAKTNKMLWTYQNKFLICHAIDSMLAFVSSIIVVTGNYQDEIQKAIGKIDKVKFVHNDQFALGMFSSVIAGVSATNEDILVLPGDCPFVSPRTYKKLLEGTSDIRVPSYLGTTGHPLFIKAKLKEELLKEPRTSNLKKFRDNYKFETIKVDDPNILMDIDTPEDYEMLLKPKGKDPKNGI